ncbi:MAG: DUF2330 domain-containing protein [Fimbriimonas sp.]|nr:DUF2330 domain-containing protein [Fimbriimonas sp.]
MKRFWTTLALFAAYQSWACCGVGAGGVRFLDQQDIVVWNHKTKTEHFIRKANFEVEGKQMGFIAPSPTVPVLALADPVAFKDLEKMRPKPIDFSIGCSAGEYEDAAPASAAPVEVAQIVDLGQYEATTLRSTDPLALIKYLQKHGYNTSADIESWTESYLKKKWYLTAFRLKAVERSAAMSPIRMSFKTDKPFFPYLVPSSNRAGNESRLRVFVLGAGVASADAAGARLGSSDWNTPVPENLRARLAQSLQLSIDDLAVANHLTAWESIPFPSEATDDAYLSFSPPRPLWLDVGAYALVGFAGVYCYRRFRLARSNQKVATD